MTIAFPIRAERVSAAGVTYAHLIDTTDRVIAVGLLADDAEQLVAAANAGAKIQAQPLEKQPRRKNKRERIADALKASDPLAVLMERDSEIVYGHYDELPQAGEILRDSRNR